MKMLSAVLLVLISAAASAQGKPKPRRTSTPTATATLAPPTATPTPIGIDRAKFEKLFRAGKVLVQAAFWETGSWLTSVRSAKREFEEAQKTFDLELSVAKDLASVPAEMALVTAYEGVSLSRLAVFVDFMNAETSAQ